MRIAVLDDNTDLPELIPNTLALHDHVCRRYMHGESFLQDMRRDNYDLLIVNWRLADMDGSAVVQAFRAASGAQVPILFLTRHNDERDVVQALACGADDAMPHPLRMAELVARTAALMRRAFPDAVGGRLEFGGYRFDTARRAVSLHGETLDLKNREFELALFLFRNPARLLSRAYLRELVWGDASEGTSRSLDTHISRLRSKLDLKAANGYTVSAIYGLGYRLDVANLPIGTSGRAVADGHRSDSRGAGDGEAWSHAQAVAPVV